MQQLDIITGHPVPLVLEFLADPGHGWLMVDTEHLRVLGIANQISAYSYISKDGRVSYLEEDCDAGIYLRACKAAGITVQTKEHHSNGDSFIRRLPGYPAQPRLIG